MELFNIWSLLRGFIRNNFSFAEIKDLVGSAGLPIHELSHLQQRFRGGASKGQLMDGIDGLFLDLSDLEKKRFVSYCIEEILSLKPDSKEELEALLERVGWGISENEPYPIEIQIDFDTTDFPDEVKEEVKKCLKRFRNGDVTGAMTSICGAVDSLTAQVYNDYNLGNHRRDSYQPRVVNSVDVFESNYKEPLLDTRISEEDANLMWHNHRQAVNQAGYVLASLRREFSDVHGEQESNPILVQRALDCAVFIIRSITSLL